MTVFFALDGFVFAGWVVRIPAIKEQTDASASALGLALLGVSAGAVITMMLTGRLCRRFGNHPVTVACAALVSVSVALPPLAHSPLALGAVLLVFGAAYGGLNVAMNSAAVDLVAALRRPVMPSFHAAFSLGGMIGAGAGGLVAAHLSPARHLFALTVTGLVVTVVAGRALSRAGRTAAPGGTTARDAVPALRDSTATSDSTAQDQESAIPGAERSTKPLEPTGTDTVSGRTAVEPVRHPVEAVPRPAPAEPVPASAPEPVRASARPPRPAPEPAPGRRATGARGLVLVFGLIALCTAYGEGALADWGALHLEQDLGAHTGVGAAGYSCFALAMTIGRLTGTASLERFGRTRTLVGGGLMASAGMLLGSLAPSVWAALLGFGVTGLGLANIFPVAVERAGALTGPGGVAAASTLGYGGMLLGPPAIGFMADWFSLSAALTSVAVLAAVAAAVSYATRRVA